MRDFDRRLRLFRSLFDVDDFAADGGADGGGLGHSASGNADLLPNDESRFGDDNLFDHREDEGVALLARLGNRVDRSIYSHTLNRNVVSHRIDAELDGLKFDPFVDLNAPGLDVADDRLEPFFMEGERDAFDGRFFGGHSTLPHVT
jgi:hypothetical protein